MTPFPELVEGPPYSATQSLAKDGPSTSSGKPFYLHQFVK